jgi:hypothetical protein
MPKFDTPTPISAVLDIPAGRIQLIAADRTDTTVEVRPANASKSRDVKAAEQITVEYLDGVLQIAAPTAKNQYFGPSGSVEVTVQLPAGSGVQAKAGSAQFRGVGRLGDVAFDGAYSKDTAIKIDEAASARLTAHAGDVTVGRLSGPAQISTGAGDIAIAEAATGTVELRTGTGDVSVGAARGASASLDAGTGYGRIHNSLMNTEGADPALDIHATTGHGDISARSL